MDHPIQLRVSPDFAVLIGRGPFDGADAPTDAVAIAFSFGSDAELPSLTLAGRDARDSVLEGRESTTRIVLLASPTALDHIAGVTRPGHDEILDFHLPSGLRAIALALRDTPLGLVYRGAKGIELICETWAILDAGELIPLTREAQLSRDDTLRIVAARRLIDERWNEKLSLEQIAAQCGLNREKLTRGFRQMFGATVAEALAEKRLQQASHMLLTTDLPVSLVGYESGYLNNASFARAFGRRFGASPSDYRARQLAA